MSVVFLDSSALIKRYVAETGSGWIRTLVSPSAGNHIVIAHITSIEIISGLARKQREVNIMQRTMQAAILLLERHVNREYVVVNYSPSIENKAKLLLTSYPLRAYDSVQLASAWMINQTLINKQLPSLMFVSSDSRLLNIASQEGLTVDDPLNHA